MKRYLSILIALAAFTAVGCQQEELKTYADLDGGLNIYFYSPSVGFSNLNFGKYDSYADSLETSFFLYPGQSEITLQLSVSRSGFSDQDTHFAVGVESTGTTAEASDYELPASCLFPAGAQTASFPVKLKYSSKMETDTLRLVVKLLEGGDYGVASSSKSLKVINFHNGVMQPSWWTGPAKMTYGLGAFSEKKYALLMMVSDNYPFDDDTPNEVVRQYALLLKQYLREQRLAGNTIYEDDGTEMTIPAGGY